MGEQPIYIDEYFFRYIVKELEGKDNTEIVGWYVKNLVFKNEGYLERLQRKYCLPNDILKMHEMIVKTWG